MPSRRGQEGTSPLDSASTVETAAHGRGGGRCLGNLGEAGVVCEGVHWHLGPPLLLKGRQHLPTPRGQVSGTDTPAWHVPGVCTREDG
jgi:hypothetical protein